MKITEILTSLDPATTSLAHLAAAACLAARHDARVTVLFIHPLRDIPLGARLQMRELEQLMEQKDRVAAEQARAGAETLMAARGVAWQWEEAKGPAEEILARRARTADLVVTAGGSAEQPPRLMGHLVMHSGRPALAVPADFDSPVFPRRILVAWDGGREVTRALHDAMPLLATAEQTELLIIVLAEYEGGGQIGGELCAFLAGHGVNAVPRVARMLPGAGVDDMILAQAAEAGADLIVMGAFGRPRLQEVVLGSVTEGVVSRATCPVLLSH